MSFGLEGTVAPTMEFSESEIVFPRISIAFDLILSQLVYDTPCWLSRVLTGSLVVLDLP